MIGKDIFQTSDLALAAYLRLQSGIEFQGILPSNHAGRGSFLFKNQDLKPLIDAFYNNTATVNPLAFSNEIRNLKIMCVNLNRDGEIDK